jgi:hypothetical protein
LRASHAFNRGGSCINRTISGTRQQASQPIFKGFNRVL